MSEELRNWQRLRQSGLIFAFKLLVKTIECIEQMNQNIFKQRIGKTLVCAVSFALLGCAAKQQASGPLQDSGDAITVYAAGDIADCRWAPPKNSGAEETATLIETDLTEANHAVVLTLGDNTYPVGRYAEFSNCYDPTWGRFKQRTYPSPGNHDYGTGNADGYFDYFGEAAGPARRGYYSFMLGNWHIISLNSNLRGENLNAQLAWLKTELRQQRAQCTLAFWHHPRYSSGGHGNNKFIQPLWEILAEGGVDIALTGHDHHYERFAPMDGSGQRDEKSGMQQFVVGTGGTRLTPIRIFRKNSEAISNASLGVLKLRLKQDGYDWTFLPVSPDSDSDQGTAQCR